MGYVRLQAHLAGALELGSCCVPPCFLPGRDSNPQTIIIVFHGPANPPRETALASETELITYRLICRALASQCLLLCDSVNYLVIPAWPALNPCKVQTVHHIADACRLYALDDRDAYMDVSGKCMTARFRCLGVVRGVQTAAAFLAAVVSARLCSAFGRRVPGTRAQPWLDPRCRMPCSTTWWGCACIRPACIIMRCVRASSTHMT